ncbi:MAG: hypothetical protein KIT58_11730 [Planctomycetota bacterium]|nr:hypothetical protein [Planctomycetota bacterium]
MLNFLCLGCLVTQVLLPGAPRACVLCGFNALKDLFWPDDDAHPDDPETAKKKKEAKKKPHPPFADCPGLCLQRHLFDVWIETDRHPKPGMDLALVARYDPFAPTGYPAELQPLVPSEIRPNTASLTWKILEGADLATFEGGRTELAGTNSTRTNVMLHFGAKARGEVRVRLVFKYHGLLDVPEEVEVRLPVGLQRDKGEREASRTSPFRVRRRSWPAANPFAGELGKDDADDLCRVYHASDFAVGSSDLDDLEDPKIGSKQEFNLRFADVFGRLGAVVERPHNQDPEVVKRFRRKVVVRGFTDALGEDRPDEQLRTARVESFANLTDLWYPEGADHVLISSSAVNRDVAKAITAQGWFVAPNGSAEDRSRNRSIVLYEVLQEVGDREKSPREREDERCADRLNRKTLALLIAGFELDFSVTKMPRSDVSDAWGRFFCASLLAGFRENLRSVLESYEDRKSGKDNFAQWLRKHRPPAERGKDSGIAYFPALLKRDRRVHGFESVSQFGVAFYVREKSSDITANRRMVDDELAGALVHACYEEREADQQVEFNRRVSYIWFELLSGYDWVNENVNKLSSNDHISDPYLGKVMAHMKLKNSHPHGGVYGSCRKDMFKNWGSAVPIRVLKDPKNPKAGAYELDEIPWPCG